MPGGFGPAALLGLIFGFMWGIGCSLAILYSIFLGGYRKAVKDSLQTPPPPRYAKALAKVQQDQAEKAAQSRSASS